VIIGSGWGRIIAAFLLGASLTVLWFGWMLGFNARSLRWAWGADGERWTAEELAKLGSDWSVYHDLPDGRGNWDHVAVGPPGVFVIDSKYLSAPATVDENGLRSGRLRAGGGVSRGSAVRMKECIEARTGLSVWVQAVVAVWGNVPGGVAERDKVLYVPASQLVEQLVTRPTRLGDAQRAQVGAALDSHAAMSG
jgi:hypothetical protein